MAYAHRHPPQSLIRRLLDYNPETGIFVWREVSHWRMKVGDVAGTAKNKYRVIGVNGYGTMGAHRLAWIYMFGDIPYKLEIDHIDRDGFNNKLSNLRLATSRQQKRNKCVQSNNQAGLKGAYLHACRKGKRWRSQIKIEGKLIFLGYFHTAQEAHEAYCKAAFIYYGEFACIASNNHEMAGGIKCSRAM